MILTGFCRLGRDAELRFLADGTPVTNLAVAFNYGMKDTASGKRPSQWVEASLWGKQAEAMAPYLLKGQPLDLTLRDVHTDSYVNGAGQTVPKLVGRVLHIDFAGAAPEQGSRTAPQSRQAAPQNTQQRGAAPAKPSFDDLDDDIPF